MSDLIGHVVNALALAGMAGLVYIAIRLLIRKTREVSSESPADENLRQHISQQAKTEQRAIERAVNSDDAPDALADLGNRRRE